MPWWVCLCVRPIQVLCTDVFYSCLSKAAQAKMRLLDKVRVKGSAQAVDMYTYDVFLGQRMVPRDCPLAWGPAG